MNGNTKEGGKMSKAKKAIKCHHCGSKSHLTTRRECGTWGREIAVCAECAANGK